jgi:hypothetical protein
VDDDYDNDDDDDNDKVLLLYVSFLFIRYNSSIFVAITSHRIIF